MNIGLNALLSLLLAFQLFFIAFFLLTNRSGKRVGNTLLGVFFLILAVNVVDILLQINDIRSLFSFVLFVG